MNRFNSIILWFVQTGAFQLYDIDGDGFITYDEMLAVSNVVVVCPRVGILEQLSQSWACTAFFI